jgi:hypothetical protein
MGPGRAAAVIPVLIAPVLNRYDLLERMLRSVDEPVERGLVIDNGLGNYPLPEWVGPEWVVHTPAFGSYGYPGSINYGIVQTPDAPWWLWVSNDVHFSGGDLGDIRAAMDDATGPLVVSFHFAAGALNQAAVERVGLFDEWSFWPLYFDDNDFAYRCHLAGVPIVPYSGGISEGAEGHETSLTIHSDPELAAANSRSWALNREAYLRKWGGPPGAEQFKTPWDRNLPLWAVQPSLSGRVARGW